MKKVFTAVLLAALALPGITFAQQFLKLEGKILAAGSQEPVPFAAIGFPDKGIGTVCDEAGNFELKIPDEFKNQPVCVSALGFKQTCLSASGLQQKKQVINLEPADIKLATVEVKAISAEALVKEAIRRIPENYANKPVNYTFYQRQLEIENNRPAYIIESVNEAYRNHPGKGRQFSIRKTRGMATSDKNREDMNETWVTVYTISSHDKILNAPAYLHPSRYKGYDYRLIGNDLIGRDTVFVIAFKPKTKSNGQEIAGEEGKLFVHHRSKAIIRLESKSNKAALWKYSNSLAIKAANKIEHGTLEFLDDNLVIEYKMIGNRWYLNNSLEEGFSRFSGRDYPVPENNHLIRQLVITDHQTEIPKQIPEEQRVKPYLNHYNNSPKDMNAAYWQQYNVLPLPEAYKKLTVQ